MITIFTRKELAIVSSMERQSNIRATLSENNIDYRIKTTNRMSSSSFSRSPRGRTGSFGQNIDLNYEYIIYVHKKDYEIAKYMINK